MSEHGAQECQECQGVSGACCFVDAESLNCDSVTVTVIMGGTEGFSVSWTELVILVRGMAR